MLSLLACALTLGQGPVEQPSRLRTVLPNGAVVLVEHMSTAKGLTLQFFLAARAGGTYGERHLLEHLMAVGKGDLDSRLESQGAFLNPRTLRPAICFALDLPAGKLDLGLKAMREILAPRTWSHTEIQREISVVKQESLLQSPQSRLSNAAWRNVYGAASSSAFDVEGILPERIAALAKAARSPSNVTVVVSGNLPLDSTVRSVQSALEGLEIASPLPAEKRTEASTVSEASAQAIAAPVPSFRSPATAGVLTAALAVAAAVKETSVTYTPSSSSGLVILSGPVGLERIVQSAEVSDLYRSAKLLGKAWVRQRLNTDAVFWRGFLMAQERDLRPETLGENVDAMTLEEFSKGLEALRKGVTVALPAARPLPADSFEIKQAQPKAKSSGVVEIIDPAADAISIQAIVALPMLSASDRGLLPALAGALEEGSQEYPRREMMMVTGGVPVEATLMPDHIRIAFTVPRNGLSAGLSVLNSLLQSALLRQEDLITQAAAFDPWSAALTSRFFAAERAPKAEVDRVYARVFRRENITLAVGGPISEGSAITAWQRRTASWNSPRLQAYVEDLVPKAKRYTSIGEGIQGIEFASVAPANLFPRLLALFALGSGKGSSLFRVVRQELGVSYRSEAVLSPTETGFETRLLILAAPGTQPERVHSALLKDVEKWTEAQRLRALGMAEAVISRGNGFSPFYLSGPEPVVSDLAGKVFLAGYWQMKTGLIWNPTLMLTNLQDVPLAELKEAAKEIVNGDLRTR